MGLLSMLVAPPKTFGEREKGCPVRAADCAPELGLCMMDSVISSSICSGWYTWFTLSPQWDYQSFLLCPLSEVPWFGQ